MLGVRRGGKNMNCEKCDAEATPCRHRDDEGKEAVEYLCHKHATEAGYCWGCGEFWAGTEDFDFNNPSGLCMNCKDELEQEPEDEE